MTTEKLSLFNDEQRIEDFGEVIEGAAKFIRSYSRKNLDELNPDDLVDVKKQMIWNPDWKKEKDMVAPIDYGVKKAIYRLINNPRKVDPTNEFDTNSVKAFIYFVDSLRNIADRLGFFEYVQNGVVSKLVDELYTETAEKFRCPMGKYDWYTRQSKFSKQNILHKALKIIRADLGDEALQDACRCMCHIIKNDGRINVTKISDSICKIEYPYFCYEGYVMESQIINFDEVEYFIINDFLNSAQIAFSEEEAKKAFENRATSIFQSHYLSSAQGMITAWDHEKVVKIPYVPITIKDIKRVGPEYRKKDMDTQTFMDTFKIRGGQFGNSVTQVERQNTLNHAYDALKDLADVLGIKDTSITFNGKLAIAFGARGRKNSLAHYEPERRVINLTRMKGCGTLAHEWMHALDHEIGLAISNINGLSSDNRVVREVDDIVNLLKFKDGASYPETDYYEASKKAGCRYVGYWDTNCEMLARAFACYVSDRLADMERQNDYLNYTAYDPAIPTLALCSAEEKKAIYEAFDALVEMLKEKGVLKRKELDG